MVFRGRLALVGALIVVGALATGCRYGFDAQSSVVTDDTAISQTITEVRLDTGSGDVVLRSGATASVHRVLHYAGTNKPGATTAIAGGVLSLQSCQNDCTVDYTVTVPAGAKVDGQSGSGDITVSGLASVDVEGGSGDVVVSQVGGAVNAASSSGDVRISDVKGAVDARSSSGDITLAQVGGAVTVQSGSGTVEATGLRGARTAAHASSGDVTVAADVAQDVDAQTSSGDIAISVPGGPYQVDVHTNSGDQQVGIATSPTGRFSITAHSSSGDVRISSK